MQKIINGRAIAEKINAVTKARVAQLKKRGVVPKLAVVLVGNDKPSLAYIGRKQKIAEEVGIDFVLHRFPASISQNALLSELKKIQSDSNLSGLIIQLPLPERLYSPQVLNAIAPELDVDFLTDASLGKMVGKSHFITPPTPSVVLTILEDLGINPSGKNATIIGSGFLVGKPLALLLINAGATVTVCNSRTKKIANKCKDADILVSCVGKKNLVRATMVKRGAVVIDVGYSFSDGIYSGDVNVPDVVKVARYVTPTPGGVGPITVANLLSNVSKVAEHKIAKS